MKKILLIVVMILFTANFNKGFSQCQFGTPGVELIGYPYTDPATGKCMIRFDLYFDLEHNPGGKYIYVHIWPSNMYPNLSYVNPPLAADLVNSVLTFGIFHHTSGLYMLNSYTPDPSIPNYQFTGLSVKVSPSAAPGYDKFVVEGLIIASSTSCAIPQSFTADVWESQSAAAQNVHCFAKGMIFYANDPKILGLLFCTTPRQYKFDISTINTNGLDINYKVFIDVDGNGVFNSSIDNIMINSGSVTLNASNNYKFSTGILGYLPYSGQKQYADLSLWVVVTSPSYPNEIYGLIPNSCVPLPVQFSSFDARRIHDKVDLKWITASETSNRGFYLERKTGNDDWQQLIFIPSKAFNGISADALEYQHSDYNILKQVCQYRIGQSDIDGKIRYSEIRMVKGFGQTASLLVYPNPTTDGQINIVLENAGTETVMQLIDMNGRIMRTWIQTNNKIVINDVASGIYMLRAWPKDSNEPVIVKLVVDK